MTASPISLMTGALALALSPVLFAEPAFSKETPADLASRDSAVKLYPYSPWNIDFAESKCRLSRLFGDENQKHLLFFEQAAPRSTYGMTLAGPEVDRYRKATRLFIGMERDKPMVRSDSHRRGDVNSVGPALIFASNNFDIAEDDGDAGEGPALRAAGIDLDRAGRIDRIVLRRGKHVLSFETGNMMPPFQALNVCTEDLLREWSLDPEQHKSYFAPEWINEKQIVQRIVREYPTKALRAGQSAIFRVRLIVETDGSVSDCHLEKTTIADRLDSPACKALLDAEFEPARTAEGEKMRSFYATTITYTIR